MTIRNLPVSHWFSQTSVVCLVVQRDPCSRFPFDIDYYTKFLLFKKFRSSDFSLSFFKVIYAKKNFKNQSPIIVLHNKKKGESNQVIYILYFNVYLFSGILFNKEYLPETYTQPPTYHAHELTCHLMLGTTQG